MVWPECSEGVRMEAYVLEANTHALPAAFLDKKSKRRWKEVVWEFFMSANEGGERGNASRSSFLQVRFEETTPGNRPF